MKKTVFILMFLLFACDVTSDGLKDKIERSYKNKQYTRLNKLLEEYYLKFGTDLIYTKYYILYSFENKNFKNGIKIYQDTPFLSIKKDTKINSKLKTWIFNKISNMKTKEKISFLDKSLIDFPYIPELSLKRIELILIEGKEYAALKEYERYQELYGKNIDILKKIIFLHLKKSYNNKKSYEKLEKISRLNIKESSEFILDCLKKKDRKILMLKSLPDSFKIEWLDEILKGEVYSFLKWGITQRILKIDKHPDKKILDLYKRGSNRIKLYIFYEYYRVHKFIIDKSFIDNFLSSNSKRLQKVAVETIYDFKLKGYGEKLFKIFNSITGNCGPLKVLIVKALIETDKKYAQKAFMVPRDLKTFDKKLIAEEFKVIMGMAPNFNILNEIIKDGTENLKVRVLRLYFKIGKKIPDYYIKNWDMVLYSKVITDNCKKFPKDKLKIFAIEQYQKFGFYKPLLCYLKSIDIKELNNWKDKKLKQHEKIKFGKSPINYLYFIALLEKNKEILNSFKQQYSNFPSLEAVKIFNFKKEDILWIIKLLNRSLREDIKDYLWLTLTTLL